MKEIRWEELDEEQKKFWGNKKTYLMVGPIFKQELKRFPKKTQKKN